MLKFRSLFNGLAVVSLAGAAVCAPAFADTSSPAAVPAPPAQTAPVIVETPTVAPTTPSTPTVETDTAAPQPAQAPPPMIGFDVGEYLPTDKVVQNRFGAQWFTIGIGEGSIAGPTKRGNFKLDIDLLANTKGDNRAILIPLGVQYERALSSGPLTPYVGVSADLMSSVIQSDTDGVKSKYRAAASGTVFGGLNFGSIASLEVRYRSIQKIAGYDLNGYGVTAGLRF